MDTLTFFLSYVPGILGASYILVTLPVIKDGFSDKELRVYIKTLKRYAGIYFPKEYANISEDRLKNKAIKFTWSWYWRGIVLSSIQIIINLFIR